MRATLNAAGTALVGAALLTTCPAWADWPAGADIKPAVLVDLTPEGFDALESIVYELLPPVINIPNIGDSDSEEIDLGLFDFELYYWAYGVEDINVFLDIPNIDVVPGEDELTLQLTAVVEVGRPADPIYVYAEADALEFISIGQYCDIYLDPLTITADASIGLELVQGPKGQILDVNFGTLQYDLSFNGDSFNSSGCFLGDFIEAVDDVLDFFGVNGGLAGLLLDVVDPIIADQLNALLPEFETLLEDAFAQATITQEIDLLGNPLVVSIYPDAFDISPEGLRLELAGSFDGGPADPCVSAFDDGLSLQTFRDYPLIGEGIAGLTHHAGIFANDDFINQAMYAVWRAGLLCQTISSDQSPVDLPLPINTSLLGILAGGAFNDLFPTSSDLIIDTRPVQPPVAVTDGLSAIEIGVEQLGLDFYAELDGRMTRVVGLDLEADAAVDLEFDGKSGLLDVLIDFEPADIGAEVVYNDLKPDANQDVEDGFNGLVQQLVAPLLGDLLGGINFPLPAIEGLGLTDLVVGGAGPGRDFLGIFAQIGTVEYGADGAGCSDTGDGCEGGCSNGSGPSRVMMIVIPLLVAGLRRRRD